MTRALSSEPVKVRVVIAVCLAWAVLTARAWWPISVRVVR